MWFYVSCYESKPLENKPGSNARSLTLKTLRTSFILGQDLLSFVECPIRSADADMLIDLQNTFFYKEAAYCHMFSHPQSFGPVQVIDLGEMVCKPTGMAKQAHAGKFVQTQPRDHTDTLFYGDERFLVNMNSRGYCVWCFDKNIMMADEDVYYKEMMQNEKAARASHCRSNSRGLK